MNPLLFKAHPLQYRMVDLVLNPRSYALADVGEVVLILLVVAPLWAAIVLPSAWKVGGTRVTWLRAYGLALPSTVIYLPLLLTALGDVINHAFHLQERWLLLLSIFVASQLLAAFYGFALRAPRTGKPIGLQQGLALSLILLLGSVPLTLALLYVDGLFSVLD